MNVKKSYEYCLWTEPRIIYLIFISFLFILQGDNGLYWAYCYMVCEFHYLVDHLVNADNCPMLVNT